MNYADYRLVNNMCPGDQQPPPPPPPNDPNKDKDKSGD